MKCLISRRNFLKAAGVTTAAAAMAVGAPAASACWTGEKSEVTILYTNDVHTYIDKQAPELTYAAIAALKQSYQNAGKKVLLVDAGDHVQGTAYGSMDQGASIIELMNAAGYDAATPGNHEFDYGMDRAKELMRDADFPYLSCNWVDLRTNLRVLPEIKVFVRGGVRIAFVGITTPETFTKATPAYFMNKAQTKYIYDILGGEDGQKLYSAVQKAVDKAKCLADVVIGLGHLGVDPSSSPWTSEEVIAHTTGFDAFIDGHSHTVMENKQVADASGRLVTLTQTGSYFANVGEMTIAPDGTISTRLVSTYDQEDPAVAAEQAAWVSSVDEMLGEKIAVIYKNDDVYSTGIYNSFVAKAAELGLEIVSTTTFTEDSQTDFSVQIADAKTNGADLIFLPMYYTPASLILAQAKAVGYAPTFFGVDGMDGILTLDGFDTALAEGVMLLTPFNADAEDDATRSFVTKYQEKYGDIPNQFAADAYDCVYAIYQALTNAGATSDMSASELCDLLIAQFTSPEFSFDGLTGEGMTWDETGAVSKSPKGMVIANGAYVGMD